MACSLRLLANYITLFKCCQLVADVVSTVGSVADVAGIVSSVADVASTVGSVADVAGTVGSVATETLNVSKSNLSFRVMYV